jgi:hypothetical protein
LTDNRRSPKSYKRKFQAWGLQKYLKTDESIAMLRIAERRRMGNKETEFIRRGKPVELAKLRRFAKRHKLTPERAASALDEPGIFLLPIRGFKWMN